MPMSAYVCIMDDWTLLHAALLYIAPHVDEIIIVDGGYRWMEPYYAAAGRDPRRSLPQLDPVLAAFGDKIRRIDGVWEDEAHKRIAGFEACRHRWVLRADADEVFVIDRGAIEQFFASDYAVAQAEIPIMVTPSHIRRPADGRVELGAVLFDRERIDGPSHLAHLWLIQSTAESERLPKPDLGLVAPDPVAFVAHLTHWRRPETAVARARYYVLNYHRIHGTLPLNLERQSQDGLARFFQLVSSDTWDTLLLGHPIVSGPPDLGGFFLDTPPPAVAANRSLRLLYAAYTDGLAHLNETLTLLGRPIPHGEPLCIDISTPLVLDLPNGRLTLRFSHPLIKLEGRVTYVLDRAPWQVTMEPPQTLDGDTARLIIDASPAPWLRRSLSIAAWCQTLDSTVHVQAVL